MGVLSTGRYTKRNPRMVHNWGYTELPWQRCKVDACFHNPLSATLLNLSHVTFLSSLKWQILPRTRNATMQLPALACLCQSGHQRSVTAALNEPEEPSHSGGSSKKRARSSLEVIPWEVKAVGKGSGSQVAEEMIKCQTPGSTKWQLNTGKMPSCSNRELRSTRGHNYD